MSRRATVTIRQRDPEAEDGYYREWVPEHDLERGELGVTLRFGDLYGGDVFVPWASVVRIDFEPWPEQVAA